MQTEYVFVQDNLHLIFHVSVPMKKSHNQNLNYYQLHTKEHSNEGSEPAETNCASPDLGLTCISNLGLGM